MAIDDEGKTIIAGSDDGTIKRLTFSDVLTEQCKSEKIGVGWSVSVTDDGQTIAFVDKDAKVQRYRNGILSTLPKDPENNVSVKLSPNGQTIVSGSSDGTVNLWKRDDSLIAKFQLVGQFKEHEGKVRTVAIAHNGQTIISGSSDGIVKVWDQDGALIQTLKEHQDDVWGVGITNNGKRMVSGSADGTVKLWSRDDSQTPTLTDHQGEIWSVAITPDGEKNGI